MRQIGIIPTTQAVDVTSLGCNNLKVSQSLRWTKMHIFWFILILLLSDRHFVTTLRSDSNWCYVKDRQVTFQWSQLESTCYAHVTVKEIPLWSHHAHIALVCVWHKYYGNSISKANARNFIKLCIILDIDMN